MPDYPAGYTHESMEEFDAAAELVEEEAQWGSCALCGEMVERLIWTKDGRALVCEPCWSEYKAMRDQPTGV